jgi:hypothetical protein
MSHHPSSKLLADLLLSVKPIQSSDPSDTWHPLLLLVVASSYEAPPVVVFYIG